MKAFLAIALAAVTSLALVVPAAAQDFGPHTNAGVAIKVGSLGFGVDAAVPVAQKVNIRAGVNALSVNHDFDNDGIILAASLKLRSVSVYLDWFPFGGGFHVSPGVMLYNGNKVGAVVTVPGGESFDLGDEELFSSATDPVNGVAAIDFKRVAPALVIGWGNIVPRGDRRWSIPFELGLVYSRAPTATMVLGGSACTRSGTNCRKIATDANLQARLAQEVAQLNSDLSFLKLTPVVSLGFSFKF